MTRQKFAKILDWGRAFTIFGTPVYQEFLAGKRELTCTAWAIPTYNIKGWKAPCYLMTDGHYAGYQEMLTKVDWEKYGVVDGVARDRAAKTAWSTAATIPAARSARITRAIFGFYSPDLEGFTGVGNSIEDCLYKAKWCMEEHVALLREQGFPVPAPCLSQRLRFKTPNPCQLRARTGNVLSDKNWETVGVVGAGRTPPGIFISHE